MSKKSKQKTATSSTSSPHPAVLKTKEGSNKDRKIKTVVPPQPSVEDEDDIEEEELGEDGDFSGSGDKEEDSEEESDSEDDGVDQEGMERLVKLLGEDGLDDFDRAQLRSMAGEEEEEEEEESGEEAGNSDEGGEEEEISDEGKEKETSIAKSIINNALSSADEEEEDDDDENEENNDALPLDEIESDIDEDAVPQQKLEIDNQVALERIRQNIQLDPSLSWTETLVLTYPQKIQVDVNDDLNRELAFYKQALHSAQSAHTLSIKHKLPFTRPPDYFAEMVKSDSHMERIRQRLLNESAGIKKSEEKRKEREGKKFGKQVQVEKLKERERDKKAMEERLKNLKRKRKDILDGSNTNEGGDDFDVAVEDAISDRPSKRHTVSSSENKKSRMPRQARDKKFGFGGVGRRSKQNTKESTDNFSFGAAGRGKRGGGGGRGGKKQRPGKARRMTARSK